MKEVIFIQNLKCSGCANSIQKALLAQPGVTAVKVDLEKDSVTIETASPDVRAHVAEVLAHLGYPEQGDENTMIRKAKSFVSCAIGRVTKQARQTELQREG
jgi:copper chaperone CopZ